MASARGQSNFFSLLVSFGFPFGLASSFNNRLWSIRTINIMNESELCINLWYCFDKESGFVAAIAGRGYFLNGTDDKKTAMLKVLAVSDFLNAEWQPVPDRYQANLVDIPTNKTTSFSGVIHASDIDMLGMDLFEEVFKQIESVNQAYLPIKKAGTVKVPDEPLYVLTPVEYLKGLIKTITA